MGNKPTIFAIGDEALMNVAEKVGGGMGTGAGGGNIDARIAKLEACVEHIQSDVQDIKADIRDFKKDASRDFRILFGAIIFVTLGLAGLMAKGFHWL
jgi:hypothetical protein